MAETVYKDIACRPMGDLDILIGEKDREKCYKILMNKGYKNEAKNLQGIMLHRRFGKKLMGISVVVEIHQQIVKIVFMANFDLEEIFLRKDCLLSANWFTFPGME